MSLQSMAVPHRSSTKPTYMECHCPRASNAAAQVFAWTPGREHKDLKSSLSSRTPPRMRQDYLAR